MGTIVTLPAHRRPRRALVRTADEATILLFMGVRYVREPEVQPAEDQARRVSQLRQEAPLELA